MNPRYSIIIPVYNVRNYLEQCVNSIICQNTVSVEILLIDDGSSDGSGIICDDFVKKDKRVKCIHQTNKGVSEARNVGIKTAKGEYLIFVDSDDWVTPAYFSTIDPEITECDLLYFGSNLCYPDGNIVSHQPHFTNVGDIEEIEKEIFRLKLNQEKYAYFGFTWNKVFKRDIIISHNIRFNPALSYREDELFTHEYCIHIKSLKVIPNPIYNYRVTATGLTSKKRKYQTYEEYGTCLKELASQWKLEKLKKLDTYRYSNNLLQAAVVADNIIKCISLWNKAYCLKKDCFAEEYNTIPNLYIALNKWIAFCAVIIRRYTSK